MLKVVFMGTPEFACPSLRALHAHHRVVGVVTTPDQPQGRGLKLQPCAVKNLATELGLPIFEPLDLQESNFLTTLQDLQADIFVVVAYKLLPTVVWKIPKCGTINLHASLLPDYRGAAPINWAIINGETQTGLTTFFIDDKMDTGNVIQQTSCVILPEDNFGSLYDKMKNLGAQLLLETMEKIERRDFQAIRQENMPQNMLHKAPKIHTQTCYLDFECSAVELQNLVRGVSPQPGAWLLASYKNMQQKIKIFSAKAVGETLPVGQIKTDQRSYLLIGCGMGSLEVLEIQLEGKKICNVKDFLRGNQASDIKVLKYEK